MNRRDFLAISALGGGVVFSSALAGCSSVSEPGGASRGFYFVQLSDSHWGYKGAANPDAEHTLEKAVAAVNALPHAPDFIVFTGDLTHTTDDPAERRARMARFKEIVSVLKVRDVHFLAGEHDASLDRGAAFKEHFGPSYYSFAHQGVSFIALDNVSDPGARIDDEQMAWLKIELARHQPDAPIVVFAHRPLFDLAPAWDWATRNGREVLELLAPYANVTVFYGHIHQEHHQITGRIRHHSARSLIFPLPKPGSQPTRSPLPWDPNQPYMGLGVREVALDARLVLEGGQAMIDEIPLGRS